MEQEQQMTTMVDPQTLECLECRVVNANGRHAILVIFAEWFPAGTRGEQVRNRRRQATARKNENDIASADQEQQQNVLTSAFLSGESGGLLNVQHTTPHHTTLYHITPHYTTALQSRNCAIKFKRERWIKC
eukprot:jgi/Psemu1/22534/gm1.22534_g